MEIYHSRDLFYVPQIFISCFSEYYLFILKLYFQFSELKFESWEIMLMILFFSIHIDFLKCSVWED